MPTLKLTQSDLDDLKEKIETALEEHSIKIHKDEPRKHLGMSEIGKQCNRELYYKFRWVAFEEFDGRMMRLFARGHREEQRYISYLEGIGCKVYRFDENGKQFRSSGVLGHYGGSCDGVVITPWFPDVPFIGEFKTHNTKSFTNYVNVGLRKAKPEHFDQMSSYGYKMQIQYGLYFPENKNDDDIQITPIKLDWTRGEQLEKKAEEIILAKEPPARISDNPAFFNCSYCNFKSICHQGAIPQKNCRSCRMSTPVADAQWHCSRYNSIIPAEHIASGCPNWVPI